ncbi:hypothetical protein [Streptomyces sp. JHA26]|uniref:hypothetical protein n=1 Tax=Streptomyces sp. JHA26 TaxID=1917143 RepID=UPI00098A72F2|nr:hypothetical protein [Streptomyces sp. JHA26]
MRPRERPEAAHGTAESLVAMLPRLSELHGRTAVGITGEDARTLVLGDGTDVQVDPGVVRLFLDTGHVPVVSSVAYDSGGGIRFLGAVTAAVALADALQADLMLPAGAEGACAAAASVVDMSVPHAVLRRLHRLDDVGGCGPGTAFGG